MDDKLTFTLKSPITDEQWNKITDADFEHTDRIWFETKHGKVEFVKASAQPESCGDAVSREAITSWLERYGQDVLHGEKKWSLMYIWKNLMDLPSAQPERKCGKWVHGREIAREMVGDAIIAIFYEGWQCSECKCTVEEEREPLWKFCPNCGAKMEDDG